MEYSCVLNWGSRSARVIFFIFYLCTAKVTAQTEGDTGYDYEGAYEYQEESVLGVEPNFDVPIVNVTVVSGQTAVLPCSIDYLGKYKVAWLDYTNMVLTLEDRTIIDDPRFEVRRHQNPREWNLQIADVRHDDQGQYKCTINTEPGKSKSVVLHVKVPAQILDDQSSGDLKVQEGETVVLVCNVTGVPRPEVTWYRRAAADGAHDRERIGHTGEVIIIQNVSRYCDDIYECIADNGVPPAVSRQMAVTVEFPPEITMPNRRIRQDLGKETILECVITAYPHARNYWEKDGRELSSLSLKYRLELYDYERHTITLSLTILNITEQDYGRYRCVASNALGTDTETMDLTKKVQLQRPRPVTDRVARPEEGDYSRPTEPKPAYTAVGNDGSKAKPINPDNDHNNIKTGQQRSSGVRVVQGSALCWLLVPALTLLLVHSLSPAATRL